jgi:hypothetical protein
MAPDGGLRDILIHDYLGDAMEALSSMSRNRVSRLLGVISLKDLLRFIASKVELEA